MRLLLSGPLPADAHYLTDHPERPARIEAVRAALTDLRLGSQLQVVSHRRAERFELELAHDRHYLDDLERFCRQGGGLLDPDTFATHGSWVAACDAAGAGLGAIQALIVGNSENGRSQGPEGFLEPEPSPASGRPEASALLEPSIAFVVARPPGHHAESGRAMGFCLVNSVAVAAAFLAERGERVLIVDWDVHHGNGTQSIFWDDPRVLYVSLHQWPLYPGTGAAGETGGPSAPGLTVNMPLPPKSTGDVARRCLEEIAMPVVERFAPTWVLVSAGYDAHRDDPLSDMGLSAGDYAGLAKVVASMAPLRDRLVFFLEGGYQLSSLRRSVRATMAALLDSGTERSAGAYERDEGPTSGGGGAESAELVASIRRDRKGSSS
ncbi:MAG: histone deacetylase [Actinomycetota bacterium]|jgi:acetoin utilization deacetylase AcuC-like enzyme|nr:histone deacetylase [Actinomycetota bacterium]